MNTVGDLKKRILLLLGDDVASSTGDQIFGGQYSSDALIAGIHAALDAILPWAWKRKVQPFTSSPDGFTFALPADLYQVEGVTLSTRTVKDITIYPIAPRMEVFKAGQVFDLDAPYFLLFPEGNIVFSYKVDLAAGAKLFYSATWAKPSTDDAVLETPEYALTALSYYAASQCLLGKAVASANIRQYATKVDSGTPEDNPILIVSTHFQKIFDVAVQRLPAMPRGTLQ